MWWKTALIIVSIPIAALLIVAILGLFLPKGHTASRSVSYGRSAETVWSVITEFEAHPSWRPEIERVERLEDRDGRAVWREVRGSGDTLSMEVIELDPSRRMVTRVVDNPNFGGTWTWEIEPTGDRSCTLTITEDGEIYNPIFRFVAHFIMGYHGTIDSVHRALAKRFGESIDLSD